jgi:hypothetical protein
LLAHEGLALVICRDGRLDDAIIMPAATSEAMDEHLNGISAMAPPNHHRA